MLKIISLITAFLLLSVNVFAFFPSESWCVGEGFSSCRNYWSTLSGIAEADAPLHYHIYYALGDLGYTGTLNDRLLQYLEDETGQSGSLNDLMAYYNANVSLSSEQLVFSGDDVTFDGDNVIN